VTLKQKAFHAVINLSFRSHLPLLLSFLV